MSSVVAGARVITCHVPGDEDKRQVYSRQCLVECLVTGDTQLARTLIQVTSL